jgi:hypothetical protein
MSSFVTANCQQSNQLPPGRILIVEDEPVMQLGSEQFLADYALNTKLQIN